MTRRVASSLFARPQPSTVQCVTPEVVRSVLMAVTITLSDLHLYKGEHDSDSELYMIQDVYQTL